MGVVRSRLKQLVQKKDTKPSVQTKSASVPVLTSFTANHNMTPQAIIQRAAIDPSTLTRDAVMQLQRTIGNQAVGRLLRSIQDGTLQQKRDISLTPQLYQPDIDALGRSVAKPAKPIQRYKDADYFHYRQGSKTPMFTTESEDPELTYSRSWTSLWLNRDYKIRYPKAHADPDLADLLVADDNSLAIHKTGEHPKEFYAKDSVVSTANDDLEAVQSSVRLKTQGNTVTVEGQRLDMVQPENVREPVEEEETDFVNMMQHECFRMAGEVIGMSGNVQNEVVLGQGGKERTVEINPNPLREEKIERLSRALARSGSKISINAAAKAMEKGSDMTETDAKKYGKRSGKGRLDKHERILGINKYTAPEVGEGFAIFSNAADPRMRLDFSKLLSGGRPTERDNFIWGYHFAGVVAKSEDGKDRITLENYSRANELEELTDEIRDALLEKYRGKLGDVFQRLQGMDHLTFMGTLDAEPTSIASSVLAEYRQVRSSSKPERRWFFQIYGSKPGQSFHEKQAESGFFVNPLTVRVRKPLENLKRDTIQQVDQYSDIIDSFVRKYENSISEGLVESNVLDKLGEYARRIRSAKSQRALKKVSLSMKAPTFVRLIQSVTERHTQATLKYIGSDKSTWELISDFSIDFDIIDEIKDLENLKSVLVKLQRMI